MDQGWKKCSYEKCFSINYQPSTILTLETNSEALSGQLWKKLGIYEIVIEPCACTCVINLEINHIWFQRKKYGIIVLASLLSFDSNTRQTIFLNDGLIDP